MSNFCSKQRLNAALVLVTMSCLTVSTAVQAQDEVPLCTELNLPTPIYGAGSSAGTPSLSRIASALAAAQTPITILYADPSLCASLQAFVDNHTTSAFKYWLPNNNTPLTCVPPNDGQTLDFAYAPAVECNGVTLPADVVRFPGPVHALNIVTARDSSQTAISREALYFVYGFGADSQAAPWTDEEKVFQRSAGSFLQQWLGAALELSPSSFRGALPATDGSIIDHLSVAAVEDPDATLAFVASATAQTTANREVIRTLAYQHTGQSCGYWPSLREDTFDQLNVRRGVYQLWTPGHFYARVNEAGVPKNAVVANLLQWFAGAESAPAELDVVRSISEVGEIPTCAMQVSREGLAGAISSVAPEYPCNCYFDFVATGTTTCGACTNTADCQGTEHCRRGYCEAY